MMAKCGIVKNKRCELTSMAWCFPYVNCFFVGNSKIFAVRTELNSSGSRFEIHMVKYNPTSYINQQCSTVYSKTCVSFVFFFFLWKLRRFYLCQLSLRVYHWVKVPYGQCFYAFRKAACRRYYYNKTLVFIIMQMKERIQIYLTRSKIETRLPTGLNTELPSGVKRTLAPV
jgi:hypothetical protein